MRQSMFDHYALTASFAPRCVVKQIVEHTAFDESKGRMVFDLSAAGKQVRTLLFTFARYHQYSFTCTIFFLLKHAHYVLIYVATHIYIYIYTDTDSCALHTLMQALAVVCYEQVDGAVLMADASGFTALTEKLSSRENGAEMLCNIINNFFSILIDIVLAYGGDVVQFAGDAVLVMFEVGTDVNQGQAVSMCEAVRRAVQASADIHAALHEYPAWGDVTLALHVGVGCGKLTTVHVGGVFDRHEFVMAGEPMR